MIALTTEQSPKPESAGFSKKYRLTKTDEFSSVFGFRKVLRSPHFFLHYGVNQPDRACGARLGVVVAKRLLRRAVDRNLVKRLAREAFRRQRGKLPPRDLIMRLSTRPALLDRQALASEIQRLLEKMISPGR